MARRIRGFGSLHHGETRAGFTLLEIIIILGIGAVLVSAFFAIISGKQAGWRDETRLEEIKMVEDALYTYFLRHREFPICPRSPLEDCLGILTDEKFLAAVPHDPSERTNAGQAPCGDLDSHIYCYESLNGRDYGVTYNLETDAVGPKGWNQSGPAAKH